MGEELERFAKFLNHKKTPRLLNLGVFCLCVGVTFLQLLP